MGWFSKSEPVYSELGTKLYEAVDDHPEWQVRRDFRDYILHMGTGATYPYHILIEVNRFSKVLMTVEVKGISILDNLTSDDKNRIAAKVYDKGVHWDQKTKVSLISQSIAEITKTKAITFDSTATALARAVLAGDAPAVLAIIDYFIEHRESVNDHVNPGAK